METINSFREFLGELLEQIDGSRFDRIDFDEAAQKLGGLDRLLSECQIQAQELEALRRDYIDRIRGMVAGIAAVYRNRDIRRFSIAETENLNSMNGQELVEYYRTVSARFREAFPSSFGPRTSRAEMLSSAEEISAYK